MINVANDGSILWKVPAVSTSFLVAVALMSAAACGPDCSSDGQLISNFSSISSSTGITPAVELPSRANASVKQMEMNVSTLRDLTGLSANQLGRLFGVSRRSVNNWISGAPMATQHMRRLTQLLQIALQFAGSNPAESRARWLDSSKGMSPFHQLVEQVSLGQVVQGNALSVRNQFAA